MDDNTEMRSVGVPDGPGTRHRILDAALALFLAEGYATGSLRRIADRVEITQAAVYYHFRAKDDLLVALLAGPLGEFEQLLDEAEARRAAEGVTDRRALLAAVHDHVWAHRDVARLCGRDVVVARHPHWQPRLHALRERCSGLLAGPDGVGSDGVGRALARAAIALLVAPAVADDDPVPGTGDLLLDAAVRVLDTPRRRHQQT